MKVAPIIRIIKKKQNEGWDSKSIAYSLVYAGSKNDPTLEDSLFDDLQIPRPDVYLGVECENLNELTGQVMSKFEQYLQQNTTHVVVVVDRPCIYYGCSYCSKETRHCFSAYSSRNPLV